MEIIIIYHCLKDKERDHKRKNRDESSTGRESRESPAATDTATTVPGHTHNGGHKSQHHDKSSSYDKQQPVNGRESKTGHSYEKSYDKGRGYGGGGGGYDRHGYGYKNNHRLTLFLGFQELFLFLTFFWLKTLIKQRTYFLFFCLICLLILLVCFSHLIALSLRTKKLLSLYLLILCPYTGIYIIQNTLWSGSGFWEKYDKWHK